jgi:ribosomal protein L11 methyltransferase
MHILHLDCETPDRDWLIAELWERGTTGIIEGVAGLRAFFDEHIDTSDLMAFSPRWERAEERDWVEMSRAQWEPVEVGSRFFLVPSWSSDPAPEGRLRLEMQPGLACGTGWHPATQIALEAMERYVAPGAAVLDVGTGSGILAEAAALLGAGPVYACDIDADAVAIARERLRAATVHAALFAGSAAAVRGGAVDLVVANIDAETLIPMFAEIRRVLKPGGRAILTGFPESRLAAMLAAFGQGATFARGEWRGLVC